MNEEIDEEIDEEIRIAELLKKIPDEKLMAIHNDYCDACNYPNEKVYLNNQEFFDDLKKPVWEVLQMIHKGYYFHADKYVRINGYGHILSMGRVEKAADINLISTWIRENDKMSLYGL